MKRFLWTDRRDADLRRSRADGFSFADCASMLKCSESEARARMRWLKAQPADMRMASVPRPAPAPARPGLIDISRAPSGMELAVDRWRGPARG